MKRLAIILIVLLLAGLLTGGFFVNRSMRWAHDRRMHESQQRLDAPFPRARIEAANLILAHHPASHDVAIIKARALMEVNQHHMARKVLESFAKPGSPVRQRAMALLAESYLSEAVMLASEATPVTLDRVRMQIQRLIGDAKNLRKTIAEESTQKALVATLEARELDVRAVLLRVEWLDLQRELSMVEAGDAEERLEPLREKMAAFVEKVRGVDQSLVDACHRALDIDPSYSWPRQLLFRKAIRYNDLNEAIGIAGEIRQLKNIDRALAGEIARELLDAEKSHTGEISRTILQIVEELLNQPGLTGPAHLHYQMARGEFALRKGLFADAEAIARQILKEYELHERAMCLLAHSLVEQDRPREALAMLVPYVERHGSAHARYALATAYIRIGGEANLREARERLRQSLEIMPDMLPARLLLVQTMVDQGHILEAKADIEIAYQLHHHHPRVKQLYAMLLVMQPTSRPLVWFILDQVPVASGPVESAPAGKAYQNDLPFILGSAQRPEAAAVVAAMCLDDVAAVRSITMPKLQRHHDDPFATLAEAWCDVPAQQRARAASVFARTVSRVWDRDPLVRHLPPPMSQRLTMSQRPRNETEAAKQWDTAEIEVWRNYFVLFPHEYALQLVQLVLDQTPDDPHLLEQAGQLSLWINRPELAAQYLRRLKDVRGGEAISPTAEAIFALLEQDRASLTSILEQTPDAQGGATLRLVRLIDALNAGDLRAAEAALRTLLEQHPWSQLAMIRVYMDAVRRGESTPESNWRKIAVAINPKLPLLVQARVDLALGQSLAANNGVLLLFDSETLDSEVRLWASEIQGRAAISTAMTQRAGWVLESVVHAGRDEEMESRLRGLDAQIIGGLDEVARINLAPILRNTKLNARQLDLFFLRAPILFNHQQILDALQVQMQQRAEEPILHLYRAALLIEINQLDQANVSLNYLQRQYEFSPRVLMLRAKLEEVRGRPEQAARAYEQIIARAGRAAELAREQLMRLELAPSQDAVQ